MKANQIPILTIFAFLISSCSSYEKQDVREFYFPLNDFEKSKTYVYLVANSNRIDTIFWKFTKGSKANEKVLISNSFSSKGMISLNTEVFAENASLYTSSILFVTNSKQEQEKINTQIEENENTVFPFKLSKNENYFLKIRYVNPIDNSFVSIERTRKYSHASKIDYKGQTFDCITFLGKEVFSVQNNKLVFKTEECFAKGLGLVRSKKTGQGIFIENTLIDIR